MCMNQGCESRGQASGICENTRNRVALLSTRGKWAAFFLGSVFQWRWALGRCGPCRIVDTDFCNVIFWKNKTSFGPFDAALRLLCFQACTVDPLTIYEAAFSTPKSSEVATPINSRGPSSWPRPSGF